MQDYSINSIKFIKRKKCIDIFNKDGKYLFIQGPKGFCNKQIDSNSNYLWISYNKNNHTNQSFYSFLKELKEYLEKMLFGEYIQSFYYESGLGITIQNFKGNNIVDLYYNKETIMDMIDCPERFYIKPLIWFQNVRCVDDKWYMNFCLVQAIIYPIYLKLGKCLIDGNESNEYPDIYKSKIGIENTESTENSKEDEEFMSYSQHPIYSKYFKMLSMGIPKGAVLIKITNELGDSSKDILSHHPEDMIIVRKIKHSEHSHYMRFFRMLSMGIPKMAVEQKMILENINISILDEPDKRILDLPIVSMDFGKILLSKKLKNVSQFKNINALENNKNNKNNRIPQFSMDDILKKRNEILNKIIK